MGVKGVNRKHGLSNTRFYRIWQKMKYRCDNPKSDSYKYYGGKGITICEEWYDFVNFMDDMYYDYVEFEKINGEKSATLDRKDSNKNYCKDNCRWATITEQNRNRSINIHSVINGKKYNSLVEISEDFGINQNAIFSRYYNGLRDDDLIKDKKRHRTKNIVIEVDGITYMSLSSLQRAYPYLNLMTLHRRYSSGLRGNDLVKPLDKTSIL